MNTFTIRDLKQALRNGPYAWPGGYPTYFIACDGEALSHAAVKAALRQVYWAMSHRDSGGWRVIGAAINWEDNHLTCAHTGERIPCAYPEEDC
jgi:hypothetical protein